MIEEGVLRSFRGKNVLVTGGTGLIGRQVVDMLCGAGASVKIVSLDKINVNDKAEHIFGDLTSFDFCKNITENMDFVFHIAGIGASVKASEKKIASHFVPMLMMNTNVLEACRLNKVKKVIYTSSVGAYAQAEVFIESDYRLESTPMNFAGWAKRMAEAQVYAYKVEYDLDNFSIVRPSNVYGPGDNFNPENSLVIPSLMYRIYHKENPLVVWGDGSCVRDFVYSGDVAEGIILSLYYGTQSGFVNLGSGKPCTIRELVETLGSFIDFNYVFDTSKPKGAQKRIMDISLAKKIIHYEPSTELKDGLKKTWEWFIKHPDEHNQKKNYFTNA
ncbi:NAD(P)-dependent oxidoreductase [Patescibacteria group bacterium]|nr:NAD(P)-dependent oxidoreductase [Patescibacteria group bacterium]